MGIDERGDELEMFPFVWYAEWIEMQVKAGRIPPIIPHLHQHEKMAGQKDKPWISSQI
jgi:hypothetical protein